MQDLQDSRHTLSIIVADEPGELSRIVGLFSARGFNIETISVGESLDPRWSRVTIVTRGDERTIQQIVKQCERLARVREVQDVNTRPHIEREMALITVSASAGAERQEVLSLVSVFRAKVVDISHTQLILEASGNKEKVDTFIEFLRPIGITDITRTGHIAISRLAARVDVSDSIREELFMNIYYDKDAKLDLIRQKQIAVIGYGSQGFAQANNLADSGCNVSCRVACRQCFVGQSRARRAQGVAGGPGGCRGRYRDDARARRTRARDLRARSRGVDHAGQVFSLLTRFLDSLQFHPAAGRCERFHGRAERSGTSRAPRI